MTEIFSYEYQGKFYRGKFIKRINRFLALVDLNGKEVLCHVKNTGSMKELLVGGRGVYILDRKKEGRKTDYDLISIEYGDILVNLDSQIPNKMVGLALEKGGIEGYEEMDEIRPEYGIGDSRLDFYLKKGKKEAYLEVKGVNLVTPSGLALFPDAKTARGKKHIKELRSLKLMGKDAMVIFLIMREDGEIFSPNWDLDPAFSEELKEAYEENLDIRAYRCRINPGGLSWLGRAKIEI